MSEQIVQPGAHLVLLVFIWQGGENEVVHVSPIAKNEVYGSFNVTLLEVMATFAITECILRTIESTTQEIGLVA